MAMMLRKVWGIPLNTSSMFTDTLIFVAAGIVFGWEAALFVNRTASDYLLEGPSSTNTVLAITHDVGDTGYRR